MQAQGRAHHAAHLVGLERESRVLERPKLLGQAALGQPGPILAQHAALVVRRLRGQRGEIRAAAQLVGDLLELGRGAVHCFLRRVLGQQNQEMAHPDLFGAGVLFLIGGIGGLDVGLGHRIGLGQGLGRELHVVDLHLDRGGELVFFGLVVAGDLGVGRTDILGKVLGLERDVANDRLFAHEVENGAGLGIGDRARQADERGQLLHEQVLAEIGLELTRGHAVGREDVLVALGVELLGLVLEGRDFGDLGPQLVGAHADAELGGLLFQQLGGHHIAEDLLAKAAFLQFLVRDVGVFVFYQA